MIYIILILLGILYQSDLIDIFNALSVRVIGAGYQLCGQHLSGLIAGVAVYGGFSDAVNVGLHCIQPNLQQRDDFPYPLPAAVSLGFCWFTLINTSMAGYDGETRRLVLSDSEAQRLPRDYFLRPQPSTLCP